MRRVGYNKLWFWELVRKEYLGDDGSILSYFNLNRDDLFWLQWESNKPSIILRILCQSQENLRLRRKIYLLFWD